VELQLGCTGAIGKRMQPARRPQPQALDRRLRLARIAAASAAALFPLAASQALAQEAPMASPAGDESSVDDQVRFEADKVRYDSNAEKVFAEGNVVLRHDVQTVRADNVTWDRNTGQILATGNIRFVDEDGNIVYASNNQLYVSPFKPVIAN